MKFTNTEVFNFKGAIRGARNPLESWGLSDSGICKGGDDGIRCDNCCEQPICMHAYDKGYKVGKNDMRLMQHLLKASIKETNSHSKFMRQIMVSVDITAPLYWWKEFDTYKVGTTANSTSTIHKLSSTPITHKCFELNEYSCGLCSDFKDEDFNLHFVVDDMVMDMIDWLESLRKKYLETKDKRYWVELIRWLPESWLQIRTITMNYQVLRQMYFDRRHHKLSLWSVDFVEWLKTLPYAKELIMYEGEVTGNE